MNQASLATVAVMVVAVGEEAMADTALSTRSSRLTLSHPQEEVAEVAAEEAVVEAVVVAVGAGT